MVFISHTWGNKNTPYEFTQNSSYEYQVCATLPTGNSACAQSSRSADLKSNKKREQIFDILQTRRITASILMYLLSHTAYASSETRFHEVRAGETLAVIARSHGVSYQHLACLNGIANPNQISIGQRIELPRTPRKAQKAALKWPIIRGRLTSPFGLRRMNCHNGIDIAAPRGTPVRAADSGKVVFSGIQNGYGKVVIIRHSKGVLTLYAHLQRIHVKENQRVRRGQRIARVGSTGRSTGPHLHFEVRENGKARDPMSFLPQTPLIVLNPKASYGAGRGGK